MRVMRFMDCVRRESAESLSVSCLVATLLICSCDSDTHTEPQSELPGEELTCVDYSEADPDVPRFGGFVVPGGIASDVVIVGQYTLVCADKSGLFVVPTNPKMGSGRMIPPEFEYEAYRAIQIDSQYAYILATTPVDESRFHVLDIQDESAPEVLASVPFPGRGLDFDIHADYAYIAAGNGALQVLDLTDPPHPRYVELSLYGTPGFPEVIWECAVRGSELFVVGTDSARGFGNGADSFVVLDISSPRAPEVISNTAIPSHLRAIEILGDFAYAVERDHGVYVIDVSDSGAPIHVGSVSLDGGAFTLASLANHLYVITANSGMHVLELPATGLPVPMGLLPLFHQRTGITASSEKVCVLGSHLSVLHPQCD